MSRYGWRPYVPVAKRRQQAAKKLMKLRKSGRKISPVVIEGRKIARTFWGSAWCDNLEAYSDYENRLPRGRTYVRNGSVIDLQIASGRVTGLVSGTDFYEVDLRVKRISAPKWKRIRSRCAGGIDSVVELLQGRISDAVMDMVTRPEEGLFPTPKEISFDCSCPDWATMCKHVAATLYGVGARLDHAPDMLFELRGVDPAEMVADVVVQAGTKRKAARGHTLAEEDLSSVFGVDFDEAPDPPRRRSAKASRKVAKKKAGNRTKAAKGTTKKKPKKTPLKKKPTTKKKPVTKKPTRTAAKKKPAAARKKAVASRRGTTASKKRSSKRKPAQ